MNRSVDASLDGLAGAVSIATTAGHRVQVALATSFTCPFEGAVHPDRVLAIAADERLAGISDLMVCDTIGQAVPARVEALIGVVRQELAETTRVAFHGHDAWGLGVANSLAAFDAGAAFVDGALGALGGCPFAPGASGNTSLEDLLFATQAVSAETFHQLIEVSEELLAQLGEPNRSRASDGVRETKSPFPWEPSVAA